MAVKIEAKLEQFPIRGAFVISRERRTLQNVVRVSMSAGAFHAQSECVPYKRYGETIEGVIDAILAMQAELDQGLTRDALQNLMPAGAARNALDCLLWDMEAKQSGVRAWQLAGLPAPQPVTTMQTISLGTPDEMRDAAYRLKDWPVLKVKLGGDGDDARILAVRAGAPLARLVADANEAWTPQNYATNIAACVDARAEMIEQPFPADADAILDTLPHPIPICADESLHDRHDLERLKSRYDIINIKLDKTGGLTEALLLKQAAREAGFGVFVGSMVATSLSIAPALLLAQDVDFVDLDGPLLLEQDRAPGLAFEGAKISPPERQLWG